MTWVNAVDLTDLVEVAEFMLPRIPGTARWKINLVQPTGARPEHEIAGIPP